MDDIKVFAKDSQELGNTLQVVDKVSQTIDTKLGLRKCAVAHIERGKLVEGKDYKLDEESTIERVPTGDAYKYLGIAQVFQPDHKAIRVKLAGVYMKRLHKIWASALSAKHMQSPCHQYLGCGGVSVFLLPGQVARGQVGETGPADSKGIT